MRAARRSASEPWKCAGSVSTEIAAAPAAAYARACSAGSRSAIAPADGDARFTSAITAGRPAAARSAPDEVPRGRHGQRARQQHRVVERMPFQLAPTLGDQVGEEAHGGPSLAAAVRVVGPVTGQPTDAIAALQVEPALERRAADDRAFGPGVPHGDEVVDRGDPAGHDRRGARAARRSRAHPTSGPVMVDTRRTAVITIRAAPAVVDGRQASR